MKKTLQKVLIASTLLLLTVACEQSDQTAAVPEDPPVQLEQHQNYKDFGDYVVHFNALSTEDLPSDVAKSYGITRSQNRAMLNVVILKKEEGTTGKPVTGSVAVTATNLTGQLKSVKMREIIAEGGAGIYYIGETGVANGETLIYTIDVTPINETSRFSAIYRKQFYAD